MSISGADQVSVRTMKSMFSIALINSGSVLLSYVLPTKPRTFQVLKLTLAKDEISTSGLVPSHGKADELLLAIPGLTVVVDDTGTGAGTLDLLLSE